MSDPFGAMAAEFVDGGFLNGFAFVEEAAAVDWNGGFEAVVYGGDDAGSVATPTDAGDCGTVRVGIGQTADEGVGSNDGGNGMVGPVIRDGVGIDGVEFLNVGVVWTAIGEAGAGAVFAPRLGDFLAVLFDPDGLLRLAAGEVHGDGGVTAFGPEMGPLGEGGATSAVDQHDGRETAWRGLGAVERGGGGVKGEDFAGFVSVRFAFVEERVDGVVLGEPTIGGRVVECGKIPGDRSVLCLNDRGRYRD